VPRLDSDQGKETISALRDVDALSCKDLVEMEDMKKIGSIWPFDGLAGGQLQMGGVKNYKPTPENAP